MIGFKRASVTATNSASRPPTAVLTYPNPVSWRMNTKRMADIISACRR
jgi:hypothetical protein